MHRKSYYRWLFIVAALWNWGAAVQFFFWYDPIFALLKMAPINHPSIMQLAMGLVFALGVGYYLVSRDISKNHDIVKVGIIGKLLAFAVFTYHYMLGSLSVAILLCGVVDLVFGILFLEFLMTMKKGRVLF